MCHLSGAQENEQGERVFHRRCTYIYTYIYVYIDVCGITLADERWYIWKRIAESNSNYINENINKTNDEFI